MSLFPTGNSRYSKFDFRSLGSELKEGFELIESRCLLHHIISSISRWRQKSHEPANRQIMPSQ